MKKRTIFIWDIHWCYREFQALIKTLKIKKKDSVYILWDMINKWPASFKVLEYIYKQKNYIAIKWNHELKFLQYISNAKEPYSLRSKYNWDKLYKQILKKPKIFQYLKNLPLYIEHNDFICLHWWKLLNKSISQHTEHEITTLRYLEDGSPWYESYLWEKKIIYGHWAVDWLKIRENTIWLDSGCVYGKQLSAYILETNQIVQQNAFKEYIKLDNDKFKVHPLKQFLAKYFNIYL